MTPTKPRTRPRPNIATDRGVGSGVAKPRRHLSPEGRGRLSEIAKQRHRDSSGRGFEKNPSSPRSGPRAPSKRRIAEKVADAALEAANTEAIIDVFKDGVADTQPMHLRLKAAEAWVRIATEDAKIAIREADSESQQRDREELLTILSQKLTSGPSSMLFRKHLEEQTGNSENFNEVDEVIDAEPIEDDE